MSEDVDPQSSEAQSNVQHALVLDTDLFFSVKIADTLKHAGYTTRTVRKLDVFVAALPTEIPRIALVNSAMTGTDWRAAIRAARAAGIATIAYGSHVDLETQQQARDEGATAVIANSKLAQDLPGVVARALRRNDTSSDDADANRDEGAADSP